MEKQFLSERLSLRDGCEVEISYKNNGTEGVWYKAIIEAKPLRELCVRFLKEDFSTPLNELRDKVLIRPIPPKNVQACIDIEIGTIVDADYKDAWWTGFVVKEIGDDQCLVFFDSLSEIIQFGKKHLRPHLEWVDEKIYSWWIIRSTQNSEFLMRLAEEPMFSPGTMVELRSKINETDEFVWVPAMVIKEFKEGDDGEFRYIVKDMPLIRKSYEGRPNKTVDLPSLRPIPPFFRVEEYQVDELIEVYHDGYGWRQGRVTESQIPMMGRLWCGLLMEATKKKVLFKKSDLRPLKVWEDGVWKTRELSLTQGSGDKMGDSVMNANESDPHVTPPPGMTITPLKQVKAENDSTRENGNNEDINRKRKREDNLCSVAKDTTMVLPFEKKSPFWKILESMEVFKTVPQSPHFNPLVETREESREMLAVGMMFTFSGLLDEVKLLPHKETISSFIRISISLDELEKHGFNVKGAKSRICKLLTLRGMQSKKEDELKGAKKVTGDKESAKVENKRKILELQRLNEEMDKEIAESMSCEAKIVQELDDVKLEFQATASAPW
ncbi:PREDICTED: DUF724 domain-containing protein 10-like [Camelina sativa]|uniref:DUF724 domain-containing protein 10-like n=1 Tax=Camelina sativa TaxID=90675 RepID=A0ABM0T5J2_CAMSA|nr:PREDICTED: DUF724 domain-containing protein 10-like [Camelina sativa]